MAGEVDLDPQLRDFLVKSNLLESIEDVSGVPIQQLRQGFDELFR